MAPATRHLLFPWELSWLMWQSHGGDLIYHDLGPDTSSVFCPQRIWFQYEVSKNGNVAFCLSVTLLTGHGPQRVPESSFSSGAVCVVICRWSPLLSPVLWANEPADGPVKVSCTIVLSTISCADKSSAACANTTKWCKLHQRGEQAGVGHQ